MEGAMKGKILAMLKELQPTCDFEGGEDFIEAGYLGSFDIVQLVADMEDEFGVLVDGLDIVPENFGSLEAMAALVERSREKG